MLKRIPFLMLVPVVMMLTSCGPSAEDGAEAAQSQVAIAGCEQAIREKAEVPRSVSFGQILDDLNFVLREENLTLWSIDGEFTQQVGDHFVVPHFYSCAFRDGKVDSLIIYTGHPADFNETASLSMCRQAIAGRSEFPDRAVFKPEEADPPFGSVPYWVFDGTVHLLDASGAMVPYRYFCHVNHGEIRQLKLTETK